jgi:hypothetical protein
MGTELGDKEGLIGASFGSRLGTVGRLTSPKPFIVMYDSGVRPLQWRRLRRIAASSTTEERVS